MFLEISKSKLANNLSKAQSITKNVPISLMIKDYYKDIKENINHNCRIYENFGSSSDPTICTHISKFTEFNSGVFIINERGYKRARDYGHDMFYIPIDCGDGREGLSFEEAIYLKKKISSPNCLFYAAITSGCINCASPSYKTLENYCIMLEASGFVGLTVGGSFFLGLHKFLPDFILDLRIGEYLLYGTIPFREEVVELIGEPSLKLKLRCLKEYKSREEVLFDGGSTIFDPYLSRITTAGLELRRCSSDYLICSNPEGHVREGDWIEILPNYQSLIKLRHVRRYFTK